MVPEGVAAPYAADMDNGAVAVGLLMAAMPAGSAVGTYLLVRFVPAAVRSKFMGPLAAATGVPLAVCVLHPNLVFSLVLWTASGLFFGYQVQVITEFVRTVPDQQRGQAIGIASSGLLAVQGFGILGRRNRGRGVGRQRRRRRRRTARRGAGGGAVLEVAPGPRCTCCIQN